MIRCPGCGAGVADDATRCSRCGRTLLGAPGESRDQLADSPDDRRSALVWPPGTGPADMAGGARGFGPAAARSAR